MKESNRDTLRQMFDGTDGLEAVCRILKLHSPLLAGTVGLEGRPQVRPLHFLFGQNGAYYFMTAKSSRMYAELSKTPYIRICAADPGTGEIFSLSGKVCFTEEEEIIGRCVREREDVFRALGAEEKRLIAFFLTGAEAGILSPDGEEEDRKLRLPDPDGVLIGITIKKKTELRDRLSRILERRESEPFSTADEGTKLYDGALFVFAEAAKAVWPRMDIRPIERAAVFETWDEREKYTKLAAGLIGNAVIDKPEDFTYWLNTETLKGAL